jgi:DNA-binding NtrC family response regulator
MPASVLFHAGIEPVPAMPPLASPGPEPARIFSVPTAQVPVAAAPASAVRAPAPGPVSQMSGAASAAGEVAISLDDRLKEVEANLITWALKVSGGNKSKAAELLRIKRSTLGDRINRCGLGRSAAIEVAV